MRNNSNHALPYFGVPTIYPHSRSRKIQAGKARKRREAPGGFGIGEGRRAIVGQLFRWLRPSRSGAGERAMGRADEEAIDTVERLDEK